MNVSFQSHPSPIIFPVLHSCWWVRSHRISKVVGTSTHLPPVATPLVPWNDTTFFCSTCPVYHSIKIWKNVLLIFLINCTLGVRNAANKFVNLGRNKNLMTVILPYYIVKYLLLHIFITTCISQNFISKLLALVASSSSKTIQAPSFF